MRTLLILAAVALAGCGVEPTGEFDDGSLPISVLPAAPWLDVSPGMTGQEVERIAGPPCSVLSKTWDTRETWVFRDSQCSTDFAWCVFLNSGVVERVATGCGKG